MAVKRAEPMLARKGLSGQPLERRLRLRELQTSFVYSTVLAKKCKASSRKSPRQHCKLVLGGCTNAQPIASTALK